MGRVSGEQRVRRERVGRQCGEREEREGGVQREGEREMIEWVRDGGEE